MRSSMSWKQRPTERPHSARHSITSSSAPATRAPSSAQIWNITAVFPSIISMYSASVTRSRVSNSMSNCCPSDTRRTIQAILLTREGMSCNSMFADITNRSNAIASIASPALMAVGISYSMCTALRPRRISSSSMMSSWTSVKL